MLGELRRVKNDESMAFCEVIAIQLALHSIVTICVCFSDQSITRKHPSMWTLDDWWIIWVGAIMGFPPLNEVTV